MKRIHSLFRLGSFRFIRKFALFPVAIRPGLSVWLETYEIKQRFERVYTVAHFSIYPTDKGKWVDVELIEL